MAVNLGCQQPYEIPGEVVYTGDHIEFRVGEDAGEYCEGVPDYLDQVTGALYWEFQLTPGDERIPYAFVHRDDVGVGEQFPAFSADEGIVSSFPVIEHELVHSVQRQGYGLHPLLTEGVAEFFGGDAQLPIRKKADVGLADMLRAVETEPFFPGLMYGSAGRLVSFLDRRFGRATLLGLLADTDRLEQFGSMGADMLRARIELRTGTAWSQIEAELNRTEVCEQHEYWNARPTCEWAQRIELCSADEPTEPAKHLVALDCSMDDVLGHRVNGSSQDDDVELFTYRTVHFDKAGTYMLEVEGDWDETRTGGYVEIKSCAGGCGSLLLRVRSVNGIALPPSFDVDQPGEYLIKVSRPLDYRESIGFRILHAC